ncbi:MAG: glycosyltransferase [Verrucomicrobia bacterium]|nr:glycosyltransferase [Verrucomicrobiota bacterium]
MSKPVLSIGLPVYNGQRYLSKALGSLLNQEFADFELIVSDNGSTDQTEAICREAAARDARIRYLRHDQNQGATWNFRKVLEASSGEFFKYAAYDDECYPAMLRKCMDVIRKDSSIALVYTRSELIDENSVVVPPECSPRWDSIATSANCASIRLWQVLWRVLHGQACYGVIRASFLRRMRPFGSIAGDWVVLAQLAMLGKIVEIPEVLFRLRRHSSNSWNGTATPVQVLQWHNPRASQLEKLIPFRVAIVLEHMKSVNYLPLSPTQKVSCMPIACVTPPARNVWIWVLRKTGPIRRKLRAITGWKAFLPSHVNG